MKFTEAKYSGRNFTLPGLSVWFRLVGNEVVYAIHPNRADLIGARAELYMSDIDRHDWILEGSSR